MAADVSLGLRMLGAAGAERMVALLGVGKAMSVDPLPSATAARDIRVLTIALAAAAAEDPGAVGGETPAEQTAAAVEKLIRQELAARGDRGETAGIVAYRAAGDVALRVAAALGPAVDRIALVAVAAPETPLDRDELGDLVGRITAKALIMNGTADDLAANADATWYGNHLASARVEMVPRRARLALPDVWDRVLAHVAPGTKRRAQRGAGR